MTTTTVAQLPIISEATEQRIQDALGMLHAAVANYGAPLPAFDDMLADLGKGTDKSLDLTRITNRAHKALTALQTDRKEQKVKAFRQGVADAIAPYIQTQSEARAQFMALPKEVRQFMPTFPTSVTIPVEAVSQVFAQGTAVTDQVKMLHTMGYKVSKKDNKFSMVVELPTKL